MTKTTPLTPNSTAQAQGLLTAPGAGPFLSAPDHETPGPVLDPGTRVNHFTIVRHLGSGRGAHVYLARDEAGAHDVALKVANLRPGMAQRIRARMRREVDLRRRVGGHRHVLNLYESCCCQIAELDLIMISTEIADGGDLRAWLTENRYNMLLHRDAGLQAVIGAARGLAALHAAGVVHGDVKPENILCVKGVWKIGDLERACHTLDPRDCEDPERIANGAEARGTPAYMAPEMIDPICSAPDARVDVYALGMVLREVSDPIGDWSTLHPPAADSIVNPGLVSIVKSCLAPDPNARFQVVEHLLEALELTRLEQPYRVKSESVQKQEDQWGRLRGCLAAGRIDDARRLCRILLAGCPHHPGALAVRTNLDRGRDQAIQAAADLSSDIEELPLAEAVKKLRTIVGLAPDHEQVVGLIESVETRVTGCRDALSEALSALAAGELSRSRAAFDRAYAHDIENAPAAEACIFVGDLMRRHSQSQRRIEKAVIETRYARALRLARRHRHRLAETTGKAERIRAELEAACGAEEEEVE